MTDNGIVWEDPQDGPGGGQRGRWMTILQPLTEQPGRWARVRTFEAAVTAYQTVSNLSRNRNKLPDGRWEFTSRKLPDGTGHGVYARYLGPEDGA
jgi:hypothetical protein